MGATGRRLDELSDADIAAPAQQHPPNQVDVVVVGAHLSGMPLNHQLVERGAQLVRSGFTAACYRLFALPGTDPEKPGLLRSDDGAAIAIEVWRLSEQAFGSFVRLIPPPLGIGNVLLDDGSFEKGFICEPYGLDGALDITHFGGFVRYHESKG